MLRQKYLIVLVGPTASGKTALSVKLARSWDTEIISTDSRQFYRELNIGTAKPTEEEMAGVRHHFINSLSIEEEYSIGKYEREALALLEEIFVRKDVVVAVGGSGLFVKVLCEGMDEMPDVDLLLREELNKQYQDGGIDSLLNDLERSDPEYYAIVDKANPQRVIRALEVFRATGVPFSQFRTGEKKQRPFKIIKIGLLWDRKELYKRIDQRMDSMIHSGLFEEAQRLVKYKDKNALQTVGYKEIFDFLEGKYDKQEAIRLLKRNSRRYAKRQMTWFNKDKEINWFEVKEEGKIIEFIKGKM